MTARVLSPTETRVFTLLAAAAQAGAVCPSNTEITDEIGGSTPPSDIIARIEAKGWITVERGNSKRVVTIVASGARTAGTIAAPHWRLREETALEAIDKAVRRAIARSTGTVVRTVPSLVDDAGPVATNRDPCWHCGTRGDVGCDCGKPKPRGLTAVTPGPARGQECSQ